jgi:hypothetical protein
MLKVDKINNITLATHSCMLPDDGQDPKHVGAKLK